MDLLVDKGKGNPNVKVKLSMLLSMLPMPSNVNDILLDFI